ncbi:hypothetical protein AGLY_013931 [Aphis glycines]|uniref:Uncharacterized protein n=1 Tax=Aphis glycines TaxID=307491 RepID=A0A6G0T5S7_APHGL|nr:hypothetical protein AGLY_013931 [Aphis glycines]
MIWPLFVLQRALILTLNIIYKLLHTVANYNLNIGGITNILIIMLRVSSQAKFTEAHSAMNHCLRRQPVERQLQKLRKRKESTSNTTAQQSRRMNASTQTIVRLTLFASSLDLKTPSYKLLLIVKAEISREEVLSCKKNYLTYKVNFREDKKKKKKKILIIINEYKNTFMNKEEEENSYSENESNSSEEETDKTNTTETQVELNKNIEVENLKVGLSPKAPTGYGTERNSRRHLFVYICTKTWKHSKQKAGFFSQELQYNVVVLQVFCATALPFSLTKDGETKLKSCDLTNSSIICCLKFEI